MCTVNTEEVHSNILYRSHNAIPTNVSQYRTVNTVQPTTLQFTVMKHNTKFLMYCIWHCLALYNSNYFFLQTLSNINPVLCPRVTSLSPLSLLTGQISSKGNHWLLPIKSCNDGVGLGPSCGVCAYGHSQHISGLSLQVCHHRRRLPMVADGEEVEPGTLVWDPRRG